jgi:predicted RND superfamily exporter protein/outer membrane lipoprotein-sorting protein
MHNYLEWLVRHRIVVLFGVAILTGFLIFQAKHLTIVIDPNSMMPQSHPYVATTNKIEDIFGSKHIIVVGVTPKEGDVFQPTVLEKVKRITDVLAQTPGVARSKLLSLAANRAKDISGDGGGLRVQPLMAQVPRSQGELEALQQALQRNPVYHTSVVAPDARTTAILVEFRDDPTGFQSMVDKVARAVDPQRDESVEIAMTGLPVFLAKLELYSQRMAFLFPLAILIVGLVHLEAFRTLQGLVLPLVTSLLAVAWGLGIMGMLSVPMDVFNATTPILILAVAAGHAVQLLKRYYEEYQRLRASPGVAPADANRRAVVGSLASVGPVTVAAGLIAALGFFSLLVFEISSVRVFGVFTGIGILSAVVIEMTFMPALRSLLRPPPERVVGGQHELKVWRWLTETVGRWVIYRRPQIYGTVALLTVLSIIGMFAIEMNDSTKGFFSPRLDFHRQDTALNERLAGTNTLYVLIEGKEDDALKDPAVLKAMEATQKFLDSQPQVGKTLSIADFVKRMNQAMHGDRGEFFRIPESRELISQYLLLYSMSGDPGDFDAYVDYNYRRANITALLKTDSSAYLERLMPKLKEEVAREFGERVNVSFGGSVPQTTALNEVMVQSKILNIIQIGAVVFLVSAIVLRSLVAGVLVLIPLTLAVTVNFGIMGLSGIPLNIPTALCSAMAVGIGADYAIYLIFRLREQLRLIPGETQAMRGVILSAGKAVLFVASAVAAGYGVLLFSFGFYIHMWMALLIASAMLVSALTALLVVPAVILTFRPRFIFGTGARKVVVPAVRAAALAGLALGLVLSDVEPARAAAPDVIDIMNRNFVVSKVADSTFDATITLINNSNQQRVRKTFGATKLQANEIDNMRVTRFLSPPDVKGTVSLLIEHSRRDDDIWIYLPALKKVRRLVASNKKDSFVGTDFSYGDVIGHKVEEWNHKLLADETVDGKPCYVVESTAKIAETKDNNGYSKRISWVSKDSFVTMKAHFFDVAGEPVKIATFHDVRLVDPEKKRWQPMRMEAVNLQTGHKTIIVFENFKVKQGIQDHYFTTRYMERES